MDGSRIFAQYTASANYLPGRHVVILCDTTERMAAQDSLRRTNARLRLANAQVAKHLVEAETSRDQADAARAEAEALRKATLALTEDLRMDAVLDTLLRCMLEIIPYDFASVILTEADQRMFVARESPAHASRPLVTLPTDESAFLQRVVLMKKNVHLADTRKEPDWRKISALANIRSWIAVPLIVSDSVLGLLSIGSVRPGALDSDHFRRAKALSIPAAVAIHNARLYEWAQIYAAERRSLLKRADDTGKTSAEDRDRFHRN